MTSLALFDLDDTLADRTGAFTRWTTWFAESQGLGSDARDWLLESDRDGHAPRAELFELASERFPLRQSAADLTDGYFDSYVGFFEVRPDVNRAVKRLKAAGWAVGVVTNGPKWQYKKLEQIGLPDLIEVCSASMELGFSKPDPRIFEEAARRCGCDLETVDAGWMVGDNPVADIGGGQGVGLKTAWVRRGREWRGEEAAPDLIVDSVVEVVDHLLA